MSFNQENRRRWGSRCPACHGEGEIDVCDCCSRRYGEYFDNYSCEHHRWHREQCPECQGSGYSFEYIPRSVTSDLVEIEVDTPDVLYTLTQALGDGWVWRKEGQEIDDSHWEQKLETALGCFPPEVAAEFKVKMADRDLDKFVDRFMRDAFPGLSLE
jgi:hypothetical protein